MINIKGIQDSDYFWSVRGESSWPSTVLVIHYFAEWLIYGHSLYFSLYIYFIFEIFHKNEERNLLMPLSQRRDAGGRRDLCSKISLGEYLIYGQRRSQRRRGQDSAFIQQQEGEVFNKKKRIVVQKCQMPQRN